MKYKLTYKQHRNHFYPFSMIIEIGSFVEGTHEHNFYGRTTNDLEFTGNTHDDILIQFRHHLENKGYWTPIYSNFAKRITRPGSLLEQFEQTK